MTKTRLFLSVENSQHSANRTTAENETSAVLIFEILIIKWKSIRFCKSFWPLTYWIPWFSIKSGTMRLENSSNYIVACQSRKQCRRLALKINIMKWIFIKIDFQDFVQVCKWEGLVFCSYIINSILRFRNLNFFLSTKLTILPSDMTNYVTKEEDIKVS